MGFTNISRDDIQSIKLGKNWTSVTNNLYHPEWQDFTTSLAHSNMSKETIELIWMLLIDDPDALGDDEPTNGFPKRVNQILKSRGIMNVTSKTISMIKNKKSYVSITDKLPQSVGDRKD